MSHVPVEIQFRLTVSEVDLDVVTSVPRCAHAHDAAC